MNKRPDVFLEIALLALQRVPRFLGRRTLSEYLADEYCQSAVERQLEIAGDALGQLRKLDAELFAGIPNGDLVVAFRNVLAHGYATLDHRRVYEIASERTTELLGTLEQMLAGFPDG
ncbi:MAG: DUF86 domain-containing protein [Gammaproteobacteria bacterium]|nr:MAG: DUF86 domain-containing protein [Gammaproteobacteria bacterium]